MKRNLLLIGLACLLIGGVCLLAVHFHSEDLQSVSDSTKSAVIAGGAESPVATTTIQDTSEIHFEIVTTPTAQQLGLGGRKNIPDDYGMLFVFPKDSLYGFWMKDMYVPIDMIWLSDNGTIVSINASVAPLTYPNVFYPAQPVRYVLETRAGFAQEKKWQVGTRIALPVSELLPS